MAEWLLYEHDDGRHAVAPSAEAATFAHGDPAWHRVGPVEVPDGMSRALQVVEAEIARAEGLLAVEEGGKPLFDRAQTEAGIAALRTVAEAIERERNAGVAPCEPEPRMAFCPACFAAVTPEQADAPNVVRFSEQAAAVLAALVTGSAEVEYTTRPDGFWVTADNPSDLARALHDSPDALFRIAPAADEGGNDGR